MCLLNDANLLCLIVFDYVFTRVHFISIMCLVVTFKNSALMKYSMSLKCLFLRICEAQLVFITDFICIQQCPSLLLRQLSNIYCNLYYRSPKNCNQTRTMKSLITLKFFIFFLSKNVYDYMFKPYFMLLVFFRTKYKCVLRSVQFCKDVIVCA